MWHDQSAYDIRIEWGFDGLAALAPGSDAVVIVDVLSFSTCVDIAAARGARVFPFAGHAEAARDFATKLGAVCAGARSAAHYSLSPLSLLQAGSGERIVLPSPNGAALCVRAEGVPIFTACLRNAAAVARAAAQLGPRIAVIAAGERWSSGGLRPALEDWLGAGAVASALGGQKSPEAQAASLSFEAARTQIEAALLDCVSGRELAERGFAGDVALASQLNVSQCAPLFSGGAFLDRPDSLF